MMAITAMSPSQLAAQALTLPQPKLELCTQDCECGLCGAALQANVSSLSHYSPPLDFASEKLHPTRQALVCEHCAALLACPDVLTKYSRAVYTADGVYRLTTAQDVLWLLKAAPSPLVAIYNTRKSAHMVWQTPVTYDKRMIFVTWGKITGAIRTDRVAQAYEALRLLAAHYNSKTKANIPWPVEGLTLRDDNLHMAQLLPSHDNLLRSTNEPDVIDALDDFDCLNQCERWALSAVLLTSPSSESDWASLNCTPPTKLHPARSPN